MCVFNLSEIPLVIQKFHILLNTNHSEQVTYHKFMQCTFRDACALLYTSSMYHKAELKKECFMDISNGIIMCHKI